MENTNDTRRLDHVGFFSGVGVAPDGPQAHHRCFRGRPQSCPPPPLYLLPIASRIRNKRNGAGLAPATTAAHQHSMGDDPPNSGEADGRQSSGRDLGAPGAVGLGGGPPWGQRDWAHPKSSHAASTKIEMAYWHRPRVGSHKCACWTEPKWAALQRTPSLFV